VTGVARLIRDATSVSTFNRDHALHSNPSL